MKNLFKFLGIISLVLIIGFSMAACGEEEEEGGGGPPSFEGTWTGSTYSGVAYTVAITGDAITISNATGSIAGTLKAVVEEETTGGVMWSRSLTIEGCTGSVYITDDDKSTLNFSISGDPARTALGFTGTLMVSDMAHGGKAPGGDTPGGQTPGGNEPVLPAGSVTGITVDSALVGTWVGDADNGTLVFSTTGVGSPDTINDGTDAAAFVVAMGYIKTSYSAYPIAISGNKVTVTMFGTPITLYTYTINGSTLTIKDEDGEYTEFVGTKQ